jgi:EAL domain-containing protein (putative c-di-GMP-specific phosphodiesterase class I)
VSPVEFIPLAEELGLIISLGAWVLATACRQNKQWQDEGLPQLRVAVNLSAVVVKNWCDEANRHDLPHVEIQRMETVIHA